MHIVLIILLVLFSFRTSTALIRVVPEHFRTIRMAINAARDTDTIMVMPGTYYENLVIESKNIVVGSMFVITGDEAYIDSTIIDGEEASSVITLIGVESETAAIAGLTITNGLDDFGGGLILTNSSPMITHCHIVDNHAYNSGGGIFMNDYCYPIVSYCVIAENETNIGGGGGAYCIDSGPVFEYCVFSRNHSDVEGGGGIHNHNGDSVLINCTITGNWADGSGGAVWCTGNAEFHVTNCIFWDNTLYEISLYDNNQITVSFSDIEGGQEQVVAYGESNANWGHGNINEDPLFVAPDEGDYHLQVDSPCIDAGDPRYPRDPDTTEADMGALYFNQAPVIDVQPEIIGFPPFIQSVDTANVSISNRGFSTLWIQSREFVNLQPEDECPFVIQDEEAQLFIEPDEANVTRITFEPPYAGNFESEFRIESNDLDNPLITIPITGTALNVDDEDNYQPDDFNIISIFPNPFNRTATIKFGVATEEHVILTLLDIDGREIASLLEGRFGAGEHQLLLNGSELPAGLYVVRITHNDETAFKKLTLLK